MIALEVPIVAFGKSFDSSRFTSGNADLDDWLRTKAGQGERSDNTRAFLALDPGGERVIGYYATTTYRLELDEAARALGAGKRRYPVPAVLLARLAVDGEWAGRGVGRTLLVHALRQIAEASRSVGFEVVVVHAADESAVTFYARYGFTAFVSHPRHLLMPTKQLRATFEAERLGHPR